MGFSRSESAATQNPIFRPSASVKIELGKPFHRILIPEPYQLILFQYILLCPHILTADAVKLLLILIIEHIDIEIPHKAGGTSVV